MNLVSGRKNCSFFAVLCWIVFFTPLSLVAQDWQSWAPEWGSTERAFIYHAEGDDFSLTLRGEQTVYSALAPRGEAIILERSGIIQTGARTSLEIQLVPSRTVIKLSGNTSLVYNGVDENGRFADFTLLYGRMRIVSGETGFDGIQSIVIRNGGISARIIEGDIGVDYILGHDGRNFTMMPLFRLYAFRGAAEVFSHEAASFGGLQALTVEAGETLSLSASSSHTFAERGALTNTIVSYWVANNFAGFPPLPMPNTAIVTAAAAERRPEVVFLPPAFAIPPEEQEQPVIIGRSRTRGVVFGMGIALILSSVALQGVIHYWPDFFSGNNPAGDFRALSYVPLSAGILFTLTGIFYNPLSSAR